MATISHHALHMMVMDPACIVVIDFTDTAHYEADMDRKSQPKNRGFISKAATQYAGELTPVALSALSAWLIVTGVKGLAGFTVNHHTALADLIGIMLVIALARWMKPRSDPK